MELVSLDRTKLEGLTPAIELEYIEETGAFAAEFFPYQVVYINRNTWHILNPHTLQAMITAHPDAITLPCLLIDIAEGDEIGAAIALNGGINGLLAARPANNNANVEAVNYIMRTYHTNRKKLFGLGADADYWIDFIQWYEGNEQPQEPQALPKVETVTITENEFEFPMLELDFQATIEDITGWQWLSWGSQGRSNQVNAVHFYTDDKRFVALVSNPEKLRDAGVKVCTELNFSTEFYTPSALAIADIWKKRQVSREWHKYGIKTLVDLNIESHLFRLALAGVPKGWKAYSNRYYADDKGHLLAGFELAKKHAGTDEILYVVFGSNGAKALCDTYGWHFINNEQVRSKWVAEK